MAEDTRKSRALIYVPSDTPEAMTLATMKVAGVPLIVRGIMTLAMAGSERCTLLIAASQREKIEKFLTRYDRKKLPIVDIISYDEPYRVSPEMIQRIAAEMDTSFLVINANLLFERDLIAQLSELPLAGDSVRRCREGAHHLPILSVSLSAWSSLLGFASLKPRSIESCLQELTAHPQAECLDLPRGSNTYLLKRRRERKVAEMFLAEAIRHATPGPIAKHINKRISLPASLFLSKLWISPHTITVFNIIIGVFSGVFVADGHRYEYILLGALLFQMASIIDGCDGEVAKLTFRCSRFGQYIDSVSDNLSLGSFMTGLIAGYWRSTHSPLAFVVGAIMISTTAITFFWMIRYLKRHTNSASFATFDTAYLSKLSTGPRWLLHVIRYGKYFLKKDVFSFLFLLFAILGVLYWWLFIAAFGTTAAAVILTYLNAKSWHSARKTSPGTLHVESEGRPA